MEAVGATVIQDYPQQCHQTDRHNMRNYKASTFRKQGCWTVKKTLTHATGFSAMEKKSSKAGIRCWNVPLWP